MYTNVIQAASQITYVKNIGQRIQWARMQRGLTQAQLARLANVSTSTIGNVESGIRDKPRDLLSIAKALSASADWLDTGKGDWEGSSDSIAARSITVEEALNLLADRLNTMPTLQREAAAQKLDTLARAPDSAKALAALVAAFADFGSDVEAAPQK